MLLGNETRQIQSGGPGITAGALFLAHPICSFHQKKIETLFRKLKQLIEHKHSTRLAPGRTVASIEDLHWVIEDMYGLKIVKKVVSFEAEHLRGMMERYAGGANIYVRNSQSDDWKRFTATKELTHVAIDEQEDWSTDRSGTIVNLIDDEQLTTGAPSNISCSETLAWVGAIELLYPFVWRKRDVDLLKAKTTTLSRLALEYEIPVAAVCRATNQHHMHICHNYWELVGDPALTTA